jgi:rhodanese-related sulfurtransferase
MKKSLLIVILLASLALAACGGAPPAQAPAAEGQAIGKLVEVPGAGSYTDITVPELQKMLENKDFLFVNTHVPFEGDIPGTDISIPYDQISQNLDKLPADKDAKIVLYCRSDRMSNIAAKELVKLGFTNIFQLDGGFIEWENQGLPINR